MDNTATTKPTGRINGHSKHAATNKANAARYLARATCVTCRVVFRSPKKRLAHVESGHKSMLGANPKRQMKTSI